MDVLENMQKIQETMKNAKVSFWSYITDKSVPLSERWDAFKLAPMEMKEHENYGPSFNSLPDDFIMYEGPTHMDRGETMNTVRMVSKIEESLIEIAEDDYFGADWHLDAFKQLNLDALKEEILLNNLGTFDYDW